MDKLSNSEIIQKVITALIGKIGRRTSESYAVVIFDTVINGLIPRYDFLKYIKIENSLYSEGINAVSVSSKIDDISNSEFYYAIKDLVEMIVKNLEKNADFFFIKEFKESLSDIKELNLNIDLKEKGLDLSLMQFKYIVDKKLKSKVNYSEVIENVIRTLSVLINQILPEQETIDTIINFIKKQELEFPFLRYVKISKTPNQQGFYNIDALEELNDTPSVLISKSLLNLIEDVGKNIEWKKDKEFIDAFKDELGDDYLLKLKNLGVNLDKLKPSIKKEYEKILMKVLETIISLVDKETSKGFSIVMIDSILDKLRNEFDILKYVKIDKSRFSQGVDAIRISDEINNVEPYKLGKLIKEIINTAQEGLEDNAYFFIEDFKEQIGKEYLDKMDEIGANLHLLEMKFAKKQRRRPVRIGNDLFS